MQLETPKKAKQKENTPVTTAGPLLQFKPSSGGYRQRRQEDLEKCKGAPVPTGITTRHLVCTQPPSSLLRWVNSLGTNRFAAEKTCRTYREKTSIDLIFKKY